MSSDMNERPENFRARICLVDGKQCEGQGTDTLCDMCDERSRYRERLQIDPGGSDKIDELEQALTLSRHTIDTLRRENAELRARVDWKMAQASALKEQSWYYAGKRCFGTADPEGDGTADPEGDGRR